MNTSKPDAVRGIAAGHSRRRTIDDSHLAGFTSARSFHYERCSMGTNERFSYPR
jgi:hypothetical protein